MRRVKQKQRPSATRSGIVEQHLRPGEDVRFEGAPTGWPSLSAGALVLYVLGFAPTVFVTAVGMSLPVAVGRVALEIPGFVSFLAFVVISEFYRLARFRSTVYAITNKRVLVLRGVLRVRLRDQRSLEGVESVEVVHGDPVIRIARRALSLVGLGPECLDTIRLALGFQAEQAPVIRKRRWSWIVLASLALAILVGAHLRYIYVRSALARFWAFGARVQQVVAASVKQLRTNQSNPLVKDVGGHCTLGIPFTNALAWDEVKVLDLNEEDDKARWLVKVRVSSVLPVGIVVGAPHVTVTESEPITGNPEFLEILRREFEKQRIEATFPPR